MTYTMRVEHCGQRDGIIVTVGGQDTVRCAVCRKFLYNAPRAETGRPQRPPQSETAIHQPTSRRDQIHMTNPTWETVEVPRGAYISWGEQTGQHVTGKVLEFSPTGGTDFAGNPCPQLSVELIEGSASVNKQGQRTDFAAGELVVLNCGQVSLKRAVKAADPAPGDLVKITLSDLVRTSNGTVKQFDIKIARSAGHTAQPANAQPQTTFTQPQAVQQQSPWG
jgi:hypothetical protein